MASHCADEEPIAPVQPTGDTNGVRQENISGASTTVDAKTRACNDQDHPGMIRTPLRSQQEKGSIQDRLKVYCYLPKRREPLGCYLSRSIPSKVDCFRKKRATEQDNLHAWRMPEQKCPCLSVEASCSRRGIKSKDKKGSSSSSY